MNAQQSTIDTRIWRGYTGPAVQADRSPEFLAPLFTPSQRAEFLLEYAIWAIAFVVCWVWWLLPSHNVGLPGLIYASITLAWLSGLPFYYLTIIGGARVPAAHAGVPAESRVAMVVTKAPSEPFPVVQETLKAMLGQPRLHDTWLADEAPEPETLAWCAENGVRVSTRKDRPDYHRREWPRRTRCKEGNLAFFYDHYGYKDYDFVVQMDADHVPSPTYLEEMLKPFADPVVGYVSAPSICDKNAKESWSARARLYAEATTHGPLQAGYTGGWAPLCIGSHYGVRTAALKSIGGLGPDLAEDHSTTLMMNAHGWRGVHALNAIANGDGPRNFTDLVTQEFQWSRSLVTILLQHSPHLIPPLPAKLRFQFLICQLWYPFDSMVWAMIFAMPIVALLSGGTLVDVTYLDFVMYYGPVTLILLVIVLRWRAFGWLRPATAPVISWERILFVLARWPWSLIGSFVAVHDFFAKSFVDFRITPKGTEVVGSVPWRVLAPYMALTLISAGVPLLLDDVGTARGFYVFAILNAAIYGTLLAVIIVAHRFENREHRRRGGFAAYSKAGVTAVLLCLTGYAAATRGVEGMKGIAWGSPFLRTVYSATGAGRWTEPRTIFVWPWENSPGLPALKETAS